MVEPRASRPAFPPGYGLTGAKLLPWSWAVERLTHGRNYWICTTRADGSPHAMPVWGLWRGDAVVFSTSPSSAKARNLAHDPRVVVHLESGDEAVILEGEAERISIDAAAADAYEEKYAFRPNPDDADALWLRVRPRRAYALRESDFPNTATRYDWD
jgi:PPOX class probable F420-dependent enzyme